MNHASGDIDAHSNDGNVHNNMNSRYNDTHNSNPSKKDARDANSLDSSCNTRVNARLYNLAGK